MVPRRLVPLLEEYLEHHRPLLLRGTDYGFLFVNRRGGPLTQRQVTILVSNLTMRYKHRRVTPHLFRDIFAYWWLEHHPEDFLTLSKVLWHSDIKTTLRTYGGRFDESHGLRRVEEWMDDREQEGERNSHTVNGEQVQARIFDDSNTFGKQRPKSSATRANPGTSTPSWITKHNTRSNAGLISG